MILYISLFITFVTAVSGQCFFPGELQGNWVTQAAPETKNIPLGYLNVAITHDSISSLGICHSKVDGNIVLLQGSCYRCFRMEIPSVNVVSLYVNDLQSCPSSPREALRQCPTYRDIENQETTHLLLYKRDFVRETFCPMSGVFSFSYERGPKGRHREALVRRCEQQTSEMSNCPFGFILSLDYRDCNVVNPIREDWQCMGQWPGPHGATYVAFWDISVNDSVVTGRDLTHGRGGKPRYKCGLYQEDKRTGKHYLAFSKDSTCRNELHSPYEGYERFILRTGKVAQLPEKVRRASCRFPSTFYGQWHNTHIKRSAIIFKSDIDLKSYNLQCVSDMGDRERYIVYSRNTCNKMEYNCVWLRRRSKNIIEIMMGLNPRENLRSDLCDDRNFGDQTHWITQANSKLDREVTCPIVGTYEGELPDAPGFCAQLYSDCTQPDLMYYAVSPCGTSAALIEQREYQCVGQWEENRRVYALTFRPDINTYECIVGVIQAGSVVYIKDAGSSCNRNVLPEVLGMRANLRATCSRDLTRVSNDILGGENLSLRNRQPFGGTQPPWVPSTRRPWHPITARPRISGSPKSLSMSLCLQICLLFFTACLKTFTL